MAPVRTGAAPADIAPAVQVALGGTGPAQVAALVSTGGTTVDVIPSVSQVIQAEARPMDMGGTSVSQATSAGHAIQAAAQESESPPAYAPAAPIHVVQSLSPAAQPTAAVQKFSWRDGLVMGLKAAQGIKRVVDVIQDTTQLVDTVTGGQTVQQPTDTQSVFDFGSLQGVIQDTTQLVSTVTSGQTAQQPTDTQSTFDFGSPQGVYEEVVVQQITYDDVPIFTFLVYSPQSSTGTISPSDQAQVNPSGGILPEDIHMLETQFSEGGGLFSDHSPHDAVLWVEAHYDDPLLNKIRTQGLGGPIAAMLSLEDSVLVIFGSILDGRVHEAAKLLADESHFIVMIRSLKDDPTNKWRSETNPAEDEERYAASFDSWEADDPSELGSGHSTESPKSDAASLNVESGVPVSRLRGGAGEDEEAGPTGPLHHLDIHLQLKSGKTERRFTCYTQYAEDRPQVISSTKLIVSPDEWDVQPDRSYSRIGLLADGYISECKALPFDRHIPPNKTRKDTDTKTKGWTIAAKLTGGIHPIGGPSAGISRTQAKGTEYQDDRVTPNWIVDYEDGPRRISAAGSYFMQNVSYAATNDQQYRMEVQFSMGIDILNQNQALRALGYGMVVVTSKTEYSKSYIPKVQTDIPHVITEYPVVEVVGDSLNITTDPDNLAMDPGPLSLSVGFLPTQDTPSLFKRMWTHFKEDPAKPQLLTLPLDEIRPRGWDANTEQWRKPVFPRWGNILRDALKDRSPRLWHVKLELPEPNLTTSNEKQSEPGPPPMNTERQASTAEEGVTYTCAESKGKQRDPGKFAPKDFNASDNIQTIGPQVGGDEIGIGGGSDEAT
ncbi:hypothetical protein DFH09DRAFT_1489319 [Mycena vulgaris]|nr:hypothetical protein DFH09DRAFT_1489319 [Mycena vulgaris]